MGRGPGGRGGGWHRNLEQSPQSNLGNGLTPLSRKDCSEQLLPRGLLRAGQDAEPGQAVPAGHLAGVRHQ